ncbi:MAG: hypothetical protein KGL35_06050, partial [Bradyrhizobium sp.]|nr:hypothetical protein [Bradyrhizobium sp.]
MGLLDSVLNPNVLGLMGLAQGLGQASAPSRMPVPMGVAAAQGMQGLLGGVNTGLQTAMMLQRMKLLQGLDDGSGQASPQASQAALATGASVPNQGNQAAMFSGGTAPAGPGPTKFNESLLPAASAATGGNSLGMTPQQMFKRGYTMSLLGIPGGGDLMGMAAKYDPATLDSMKLAAVTGQNPADVAGAELRKQTYIAPTRLGEGAYFDPTQGVQGLPSAAPAGFINTRDQSGQWQTVPVNNGLNAAALSKGALEAAQESNKVMMVTDGSGRTVPVWSGSVAGAPPAMGGSPFMPQRAPAPPQPAPQAGPQQAAPVAPVKSPVNPVQSGDPWANVPQFTMPGGIGQDTYHKGLAEGAAKQMGDLATKYGTQADLANQQIAMNNDALEKMQSATT